MKKIFSKAVKYFSPLPSTFRHHDIEVLHKYQNYNNFTFWRFNIISMKKYKHNNFVQTSSPGSKYFYLACKILLNVKKIKFTECLNMFSIRLLGRKKRTFKITFKI